MIEGSGHSRYFLGNLSLQHIFFRHLTYNLHNMLDITTSCCLHMFDKEINKFWNSFDYLIHIHKNTQNRK